LGWRCNVLTLLTLRHRQRQHALQCRPNLVPAGNQQRAPHGVGRPTRHRPACKAASYRGSLPAAQPSAQNRLRQRVVLPCVGVLPAFSVQRGRVRPRVSCLLPSSVVWSVRTASSSSSRQPVLVPCLPAVSFRSFAYCSSNSSTLPCVLFSCKLVRVGRVGGTCVRLSSRAPWSPSVAAGGGKEEEEKASDVTQTMTSSKATWSS